MQSEHINWIFRNYDEKITTTLLSEGLEIDFDQVIATFLAADPSQNKRAVD